ncbi:hypothetical protein [Actinomadura sp. NPDC049753]|uniref:hypothetical protein n=1 Tax=Actinomadura sp. NPDC049753 TaxID=3154739 RepID=UPI003417545A
MVEFPDALVEEAAGPIAAAMPLVVGRIPEAPAAELGRLKTVADGAGPHPAGGAHFRVRPAPDGSPVREALDTLPPLLVERLLGALELTSPPVP